MTISSTNNRNTYAGNGATTVFAYTFKIFDDDDIIVQLKHTTTGAVTTQTKTTHYTVSGVGSSAGGNITFVTAPASVYTIVLYRDMAALQEADYTEYDAFPAETHETALDKLTMLVQQLELEAFLSFKFDHSLAANFSTDVPTPGTGGYFLRLKEDLTGLEWAAFSTTDVTLTNLNSFIQINNGNLGLDSTLRFLKDYAGTNSALKLSTDAVSVDNLKIDGNTIEATNSNGDIIIKTPGSGCVGIGVDSISRPFSGTDIVSIFGEVNAKGVNRHYITYSGGASSQTQNGFYFYDTVYANINYAMAVYGGDGNGTVNAGTNAMVFYHEMTRLGVATHFPCFGILDGLSPHTFLGSTGGTAVTSILDRSSVNLNGTVSINYSGDLRIYDEGATPRYNGFAHRPGTITTSCTWMLPIAPATVANSAMVTDTSAAGSLTFRYLPVILFGRGSYGGGGTSVAITLTGVTSDYEAVATIRASTNSVSVTKAICSADTVTLTFSADPGASTTISIIAMLA